MLNGAQLLGATIVVRPDGKTDFNSNSSIFIKNIPDGTNMGDLFPLVARFGIILSTYVSFNEGE
jgi:RNA recognition motif-containing protein